MFYSSFLSVPYLRTSCCALSLLSTVAHADSPNSQVSTELEEIVVKTHPLHEGGAAQSLTVLAGDDLANKLGASLGETVAGEAGIQSASFGSAVGRPVIHGLGAARVKTTEDRIDSLDVSVTSTDHAVSVEPFIANQINILKGASTLAYGSGAIGGVVDVETGRIPTSLPAQALSGRVELRADDNASGENAALRLDGQLAENWAWHIDAFSKQADDYDIPGFVESQALRDAEELEAAGEEEGEEEARDTLEGSFLDTQGGAVGLSYITEKGFIGVSLSRLESEYGLLPGGHGEEEEGEEEEEEGIGRIDLEQTRVDIEAQINDPFRGIKSLNVRLGINDYEHQEIEGSGEVGTFFENDAWEGRIELRHAFGPDFSGVAGIQLSERDFSAIGEEAFVEPVESQSVAAFWLVERHFETFDIEAGLRIEDVEHDPSNQGTPTIDFTTESASLGMIKKFNESTTVSALLDYSSRAPSIEELFSNGPHLATQTFEIGNTQLQEESVLALSVTGHYQWQAWDVNATAYYMSFDDFIYQANTDEIEDGLPVFVYQQNDGTFRGLDLSATVKLTETSLGQASLSFLFDTVDAEIDVQGNDNLPRIPASRYGIGVNWQSSQWDAEVNYRRVSAQRDVANFELPTEAYDDVSARISRRLEIADNTLTLFVAAKNLTDDEQRNHVSFVKDNAPAPGRRFELGLRYQF